MKPLLTVVSLLGIAYLCSCAPSSREASEPQVSPAEEPSVIQQLATCLQRLNREATEKISSESSYSTSDNAAYQRASKIITDIALENAYSILSEVITYKDDWEAKEIPGNVYLINGYGLGYTDQLGYGKWQYYATPMLVEPYSSEAKNLRDVITAQGDFAPETTDIFPENGQIDLSVKDLPFIWTNYEFASAASYSLIVSSNSDLHDPCVCIEVQDQFYICSGALKCETIYYWQVTGWKDGYFQGQGPIRVFCTETEDGETASLNMEQALNEADATRAKQIEKMLEAESMYADLHDSWDYYVLETPWIVRPGERHTEWGEDIVLAKDAAEAGELGYGYFIDENLIELPEVQYLLDLTIAVQLYEYLKGVDLELLGDLGPTHLHIAMELMPESTMKALEQIAWKQALGWEENSEG